MITNVCVHIVDLDYNILNECKWGRKLQVQDISRMEKTREKILRKKKEENEPKL